MSEHAARAIAGLLQVRQDLQDIREHIDGLICERPTAAQFDSLAAVMACVRTDAAYLDGLRRTISAALRRENYRAFPSGNPPEN
nr:MAG TPA: hypothetical protein [Caudoviricetes sp.]